MKQQAELNTEEVKEHGMAAEHHEANAVKVLERVL